MKYILEWKQRFEHSSKFCTERDVGILLKTGRVFKIQLLGTPGGSLG